MRFTYFTDPHIKGTNPKSRKDFFPNTIHEKIKEVGDIARETKSEAILCGGDLFDLPDPAPSVVRDTNKTLRTFGSTPFFDVIGNHDEFGQNPETIERTMLGVVEGSGLINFLSMDNPVYFREDGLTVTVTGCHSDYNTDKDGNLYDYMPKKPADSDVHIHIVHAYLSEIKRLESIPHTLIDDILMTEADIILAGHEHIGFNVIIRNGKIFCNPGALGRVSASVSEMDRMPQVAIIEINSKTDFDVKLRKLECAKPSDEVLDRTELEKEAEREKNLESFTQNLDSFQVDNLNIYHVVDKIADSEKVPLLVKSETIKRLQKAEEEIALEMQKELIE